VGDLVRFAVDRSFVVNVGVGADRTFQAVFRSAQRSTMNCEPSRKLTTPSLPPLLCHFPPCRRATAVLQARAAVRAPIAPEVDVLVSYHLGGLAGLVSRTTGCLLSATPSSVCSQVDFALTGVLPSPAWGAFGVRVALKATASIVVPAGAVKPGQGGGSANKNWTVDVSGLFGGVCAWKLLPVGTAHEFPLRVALVSKPVSLCADANVWGIAPPCTHQPPPPPSCRICGPLSFLLQDRRALCLNWVLAVVVCMFVS
jgi:hypothetical protein